MLRKYSLQRLPEPTMQLPTQQKNLAEKIVSQFCIVFLDTGSEYQCRVCASLSRELQTVCERFGV